MKKMVVKVLIILGLVFAPATASQIEYPTVEAATYICNNDRGHEVFVDESSVVVLENSEYMKHFAVNVIIPDEGATQTMWFKDSTADTPPKLYFSLDNENYDRFLYRADPVTKIFAKGFKAAFGRDFWE